MSSIPASPDAALRSRAMVPYIIHAAFIGACFIYAFLIVSGLLTPSEEAAPGSLPLPPALLFAILAVMTALPIAFLGARLDPGNETDPAAFLNRLQLRIIVQGAGCEAIAIYGFVGHILGMGKMPALAFVGAGLLGLVLLMPTLQSRMDRFRQLLRERQPA